MVFRQIIIVLKNVESFSISLVSQIFLFKTHKAKFETKACSEEL